jgi:hypothetical protein
MKCNMAGQQGKMGNVAAFDSSVKSTSLICGRPSIADKVDGSVLLCYVPNVLPPRDTFRHRKKSACSSADQRLTDYY